MVPKKNYDTNELEEALLQLPNGVKTHIVCDETEITSGKIDTDEGRKNLRAFAELIETQIVAYDFQYCSTNFNVTAPVLILSSDSRSIFTNALHVKVKNSAEPDFDKVTQVLNDADTLAELRSFMLAMQLLQPGDATKADLLLAKTYETEESAMKHVQDYFIAER